MSGQGYTVRALTPITDPIALRDATVRDYARAAQRSGQPVDMEAIYRTAIRHLEIVDAYHRGVDLTKPKTPPPKAADKRLALDTRPVNDNVAVRQTAPGIRDRNVLHRNPAEVSARWPFAMGRIRRILQGASAGRSLAASTETATIPKLALGFLRIYAAYMTRSRMCGRCNGQCSHSPYFGLSEGDAARKFVRDVEDVCDASSAQMGPWWVPK